MRILVVDDSLGWRNYHKKMLSEISLDYEVEVFDWARDAYESVFQNIKTPYDLIITDLQMESDFLPQYAGEWLTERIKELSSYRHTPILMVSATYNIQKIAQDYGVDCLAKSIAANNPLAYKYKIQELMKCK